MRPLPRSFVLAGWLFLAPLAVPAGAVTVEDLVNLSANGLGDEVLVALIESDGSVFHLTPEDVLVLHRRGLREPVILAMIRSTRRAPEPSIEASLPSPAVVPATVQQVVVQQVEVAAPDPVVVHVPVAVPVAVPVREPARPVYWGFGGTLRPDGWRPAPPQKDSRPETPAQPPTIRRR